MCGMASRKSLAPPPKTWEEVEWSKTKRSILRCHVDLIVTPSGVHGFVLEQEEFLRLPTAIPLWDVGSREVRGTCACVYQPKFPCGVMGEVRFFVVGSPQASSMGKRSLRRLLRGRAGRAWSQTTGGRKKALTIDRDFTHSLTHSPGTSLIFLPRQIFTATASLRSSRPAGGGLTVDPTRSAALGGPRERRFVGPAAGPHGGAIAPRPRARPAHPLLTRLLGPNLISLPRQMLTATASLRSSRLQQAPAENLPVRPAHPLPDLSPPTDFDGGGILALFALAAGACREGTSGGVPCLTGDGTAGACREGRGGKVL
jgi:hypothetical protein